MRAATAQCPRGPCSAEQGVSEAPRTLAGRAYHAGHQACEGVRGRGRGQSWAMRYMASNAGRRLRHATVLLARAWHVSLPEVQGYIYIYIYIRMHL